MKLSIVIMFVMTVILVVKLDNVYYLKIQQNAFHVQILIF